MDYNVLILSENLQCLRDRTIMLELLIDVCYDNNYIDLNEV